MNKIRFEICIALSFLLGAFLIRLWQIDQQSLDLDEMATAAWAMAKSYAYVKNELWGPHEGNAIGYPMLMFLWGKVMSSPFSLRLPSAIVGSLTILAIYFFAAHERNRSTRVTAAAFAMIMPPLLIYSQTARVYALYTFLSFINLMSYRSFLRNPSSTRILALHGASAIFSLYLHHISFFYILVLWFDAAIRILRKQIQPRFLLAPMICIIAYIPHLPLLLHQIEYGPRWLGAIEAKQFYINLKQFFGMPNQFIAGIFFIGLIIGVVRAWIRREIELFWSITPILLGIVISFIWRPIFNNQYFLPSFVGFSILSACGIASLAKQNAKILLSITLLYFLISIFSLQHLSREPRGADFRGVAEYLLAHSQDCSHQVLTNPQLVARWPIYLAERNFTGRNIEISPWGNRDIKKPFWFINAGYPLPDYLQTAVSKSERFRWEGRGNALAICID